MQAALIGDELVCHDCAGALFDMPQHVIDSSVLATRGLVGVARPSASTSCAGCGRVFGFDGDDPWEAYICWRPVNNLWHMAVAVKNGGKEHEAGRVR